jgi:hypothetical protein
MENNSIVRKHIIFYGYVVERRILSGTDDVLFSGKTA